jgi:hypothetical protein
MKTLADFDRHCEARVVNARFRPPARGYEPASAVTCCGETKRVRLPFKVAPMKV